MGQLCGQGATNNGIVELSTINPSNTWRKPEEIAQVKARTQAERSPIGEATGSPQITNASSNCWPSGALSHWCS